MDYFLNPICHENLEVLSYNQSIVAFYIRTSKRIIPIVFWLYSFMFCKDILTTDPFWVGVFRLALHIVTNFMEFFILVEKGLEA